MHYRILFLYHLSEPHQILLTAIINITAGVKVVTFSGRNKLNHCIWKLLNRPDYKHLICLQPSPLYFWKSVKGIMMEKHYVGSEIGQLRSVMLHRPNLSLKRLTPSNCRVVIWRCIVRWAGRWRAWYFRQYAAPARDRSSVTHWFTNTNIDIPEAKSWLLETQISDYRLGPTFATDVRTACRDVTPGPCSSFKWWADL